VDGSEIEAEMKWELEVGVWKWEVEVGENYKVKDEFFNDLPSTEFLACCLLFLAPVLTTKEVV